MKTLGIIGGMSPESTTLYYRIINREVNRRLGGNHSADIVMHSVDFEEVVRLQKSGDWEAAGALLAASATKLEGAGAQLLLVATNTMHKVAPAIERATTVPLLHVVDATATAIQRQGAAEGGAAGHNLHHERRVLHRAHGGARNPDDRAGRTGTGRD